jgi:DNA-binding MarR family transcriptional regulator
VPPSPAEEAWALFWRIFSADKPRRMAVMSELGLSFQQSMALMRLEPDEPLPMSALASALHCDNSNVTGIVDRMEAGGLVERRAAERDRRVKAVALTPLGEMVRDQVRQRAGTPPPPLAALSEEDAELLRDILQRAVDATPPTAPVAPAPRTSPTA